MVERVYIKDYFSFNNVEINFKEGLTAFTGASGAGKTLFMEALLTLFGLKDSNAALIEATYNGELPNINEFGIEEESIYIIKYMKQKNARYFINSQAISKKNMQQICSSAIRYLSLKDDSELESSHMIELLDKLIEKKDMSFTKELKEFQKTYKEYANAKKDFTQINDEEKKIDELKEFARFEIETIQAINPKIDEDKELMQLKKTLSKKEKLQSAIEEASGIFEFESKVHEVFALADMNSTFFDENMNELRAVMEDSIATLESLEELDVENLLERIEQISKLKNRYGDIKQILEYKDKKQKELEYYENIAFEKKNLENRYKKLDEKVRKQAENLTKKRALHVKELEMIINEYLQKLYMNTLSLKMEKDELYFLGVDTLHVRLNNVDIKKISSGEMNRLRLAFIATKNRLFSIKNEGVLILDEVDANLSGKEAMSVAHVLKELSATYQVLAISHQPQLSSVANEHYLVEKKNNTSTVSLLNQKQRVSELARMVSGEKIENEAIEFATKLLKNA